MARAGPTDATPIEIARARLRAIPHPPEHYDGIPYYDHEYAIPQSTAHGEMIRDIGQFLDQVAVAAGLRLLSDNPIWYWLGEFDEQKPFYPDYALADPVDPACVTALNLRLAVEVVSTAHAAKERKDTVRMRELNATNGVPEFALLYPEPNDARALRWFTLDQANATYREWPLPADRRYPSQAIPGLEIEVLPPERWQPGRKIRLWYRGNRLPAMDEVPCQVEQATRQAEQATREAEQERRERESAERQAEQSMRQAEQARAENERLLARLREAGLMP
jgi:hypothetical protein